MRLTTVKRIARLYVPGVRIVGSADIPRAALGLSTWAAAGPLIIFDTKLPKREQAFVVLHEVAHLVFDVPEMRGTGGGLLREAWREARADRFAAGVLEMLEAGEPDITSGECTSAR